VAEPAIPLRTAEAVVRDVVRRGAGCVGADVLAVVLAEYDARGADPADLAAAMARAMAAPQCAADSPTSSTAGAVR
jgi:hypothetical protein